MDQCRGWDNMCSYSVCSGTESYGGSYLAAGCKPCFRADRPPTLTNAPSTARPQRVCLEEVWVQVDGLRLGDAGLDHMGG